MNNKEFLKAVEILTKEKGLDKDVIFDAMELALTSAYKKNFHSLSNVKVFIDKQKGDIKIYSFITVVEDEKINDEEFNPETEITLTEARKIDKLKEVGDTFDTEITPKDFGRIATATAKQVVLQKIKEAERSSILKDFEDKEGEMLLGTVELEDSDNYYIDFGRIKGLLPKNECIPKEVIKIGQKLKVYVTKIINDKSLTILLSRKHYNFVKRLFEMEIPEIMDGTVLIHAVAREAGVRSKVSVESTKANIDPIGACVGEKGIRISNIIKELHGEKIDIIPYDKNIERYIANALLPAENLSVIVEDDNKNEAIVFANDDNYSLAIGKKGINIKLAARLTRFRLDIKTQKEASEMGINFKNEN